MHIPRMRAARATHSQKPKVVLGKEAADSNSGDASDDGPD